MPDTLTATMSYELLPLQLLYQGKTDHCHPNFPVGSTCGILLTTGQMSRPPYGSSRIHTVQDDSSAPDQAIYDVFEGHMGDKVQSLLEDNKIFYITLTNNCTDILQPLDLSDKLKEGFSEWYAEEVTNQMENSTDVDVC